MLTDYENILTLIYLTVLFTCNVNLAFSMMAIYLMYKYRTYFFYGIAFGWFIYLFFGIITLFVSLITVVIWDLVVCRGIIHGIYNSVIMFANMGGIQVNLIIDYFKNTIKNIYVNKKKYIQEKYISKLSVFSRLIYSSQILNVLKIFDYLLSIVFGNIKVFVEKIVIKKIFFFTNKKLNNNKKKTYNTSNDHKKALADLIKNNKNLPCDITKLVNSVSDIDNIQLPSNSVEATAQIGDLMDMLGRTQNLLDEMDNSKNKNKKCKKKRKRTRKNR